MLMESPTNTEQSKKLQQLMFRKYMATLVKDSWAPAIKQLRLAEAFRKIVAKEIQSATQSEETDAEKVFAGALNIERLTTSKNLCMV